MSSANSFLRFQLLILICVFCFAISFPSILMSVPASGGGVRAGASSSAVSSRDICTDMLFSVTGFIFEDCSYLDLQRFANMCMNSDSASLWNLRFRSTCDTGVALWGKDGGTGVVLVGQSFVQLYLTSTLFLYHFSIRWTVRLSLGNFLLWHVSYQYLAFCHLPIWLDFQNHSIHVTCFAKYAWTRGMSKGLDLSLSVLHPGVNFHMLSLMFWKYHVAAVWFPSDILGPGHAPMLVGCTKACTQRPML